jgi:hypothetical protein
MGTNYDEVKEFEYALHIHSYKYFNKQVALFEEMMELYMEPLTEVSSRWHFKEGKGASELLLSRLFNNFESSRLLLLNGLPEQAIMPMRDVVECAMLLRLFGSDSKRALRWMKNLKEYHPTDVKNRLDELEVDCPEYAFYGMLSELSHANLLSVVSSVTEKRLTNNVLIETYHFGGMNNPTWIGLGFNNIFILLYLILASLLPPIYAPYMKNPQEWWNKVVELKDKLRELVEDLEFEEVEETGKDKVAKEMVFKKLKIVKIHAALFDKNRIAADKGFPD